MEFRIEVTETRTAMVPIDAKSSKEAAEKIRALLSKGPIQMDEYMMCYGLETDIQLCTPSGKEL